MLTKFGSLDVGGDKSAWLQDAFDEIQNNYTAIRSVVFFNAANDYTNTYKIIDWSLNDQSASLEVVRKYLD